MKPVAAIWREAEDLIIMKIPNKEEFRISETGAASLMEDLARVLGGPKNVPIAFVRPDDFAVFSLNADGLTYSGVESKRRFPDSLHNEYSRETLSGLGFHEVFASKTPYKAPKERNCGGY